jgi:2,4-dienoyl-CoA reductase-like NADH-dependent reductase (Old Yellow Enzyme family)
MNITKAPMSLLFSPLKIRSLVLKNRIVTSPMCQYSSTDGFANDWHLVHLGTRAIGGSSLIFSEATAVSPEGRISPADLGIWKDEHIPFLKRITDFIHAHDSIAGIQLAHAGRKASEHEPWNGRGPVPEHEGGWPVVGPSAIAFSDKSKTPLELDKRGIQKVIEDFKVATQRSLEAGFKVIEIHAAHGYLIHEFLSPISNQRIDSYGGSFENRIRFLLEIVENVREVWPLHLPLFVRISVTEWVDNGWTAEDSIKLVQILKNMEVDVIDCSTGGNVNGVKIPLSPGYQVPLSEEIRNNTGILTGAVGLITEAAQAEEILKEGKADLIILARQLLRDPYFPLHAAKELAEDVKWPLQYERAKR